MTRALRVVTCLVLSAGAGAQAPDVVRAFVEVEAAAATVYVQQPCDLVVRAGIDAEWFASSAVPLFQQRLDQPFQLLVPWLFGAEERAVTLLPAPAGATTQRLAVGDRVEAAVLAGSRDVDGRRFELFELRCRWLPLAAGTTTIAPVELRYAFATRFDEDFLRGRQPLDRHDASVQSPPLPLHVRALPVAGRPPAFTGAVGEFAIAAATTASRVPVGATFDVELTIRGDGNLDRIAPPPPPDLPGFHVQGVREARRGDGRTFVFALLALRAGTEAVPPLPFAAFSPLAGAYVVHRTAPLPLLVEPQLAGAVLPPAIAALVRADADRLRAAAAWPWWGHALAVAAVVLAVLGWRRRRRRARRRQRLMGALHRCGIAHGEGPDPFAAAFEHLCALCAGRESFAGEATWSTLRAVGHDPATVAAAQQLQAALDAARFGGVGPTGQQVAACAQALTGQALRREGLVRGEGLEPSRPLPARGF